MSYHINIQGNEEDVTVSLNLTSRNWKEMSDGVETWLNSMLEGDDEEIKAAYKFVLFCAAVAGTYSHLIEEVQKGYEVLNN